MAAETTQDLCVFCSSLNLDTIGFIKSPHARTFAEDRKVDDILQCATSCPLCNHIADFCSRWRSRKYGDLASLNIQQTSADIGTYQLQSSEVDGKGSPVASLVYLSINVTAKKPEPFRGYCGASAYFQKMSQGCRTVFDFLANEDELDSGKVEPYSGRLRPLQAELRLFWKWKTICCNHKLHQGICDQITSPPDIALRLIDVEQRRLIEGCRNTSFVALSYVWGEGTKPCLTRANHGLLQQEGALNEGMVPATIWDAFAVTRALEERYLWVDSCCIIQDDDRDKLKYVPCMDSIYGLATLTIVATSGVGANAGLPGIRPGTRRRVQTPLMAKNIQLLETLDPPGNGDTTSYLGESLWNERGWTFQERLLSRRSLVFTDEQVYWECQVASYSEDSNREFPSLPVIFRHCLDDEFTRQPLNADTGEFERLYRILVEKYSSRSFTEEQDYFHGFIGVMNQFTNIYNESFAWYLPVTYFSSALSWPCENDLHSKVRRRTGSHLFQHGNGTIREHRLPSWSWVGWVCEVYLVQCSDELQLNATGLEFFTIDDDRNLQPVQEPKDYSLDKDLPLREWKGIETTATISNIPETVLSSSEIYSALCFWTSVAVLSVYHGEVKFPVDRKVFTAAGNKDFTVRWKHLPSGLSESQHRYEAIVVGDTDTRGRRTDYLNIMLVSRELNVAYREGMLSMLESDWLKLDRAWSQITLC